MKINQPLFFALALGLLATTASYGEGGGYIGKIVPPLPSECVESMSGVFPAENNRAYSVVICSGKKRLWLQSFLKRESKEAYWKVVDDLLLPQEIESEKLLDIPYCEIKGDEKAIVAAIGRWKKIKQGDYIAENIIRAWRINDPSGKIKEVDTKLVSCEYENQD